MHIYIHIYVYIYVCICICICIDIYASERAVLPPIVQSPSPVCGRASECARVLVGWVGACRRMSE